MSRIRGVSVRAFSPHLRTMSRVLIPFPHPSRCFFSRACPNKFFLLADRKSTLEDYLVLRHGFTSIHLESANHYVRTPTNSTLFSFPCLFLCYRSLPCCLRPFFELPDLERSRAQGFERAPSNSITLSPIWKTEGGREPRSDTLFPA